MNQIISRDSNSTNFTIKDLRNNSILLNHHFYDFYKNVFFNAREIIFTILRNAINNNCFPKLNDFLYV